MNVRMTRENAQLPLVTLWGATAGLRICTKQLCTNKIGGISLT